jgi:hypothetical protein
MSNRRNAFRRNPHHRPLLALAPKLGLKPASGAIRESAEVAEVDVVGDGDRDDRVDVHVRACAHRLVDALQCVDSYLAVKMKMKMLLLLVLVMSAGPCCVDVHAYLHFRVRVNRDENVWTEMR